MKKRRVAKLIALSMVAATLTDRCQCTGKRGKSSYGNDIH